jgi:hypothetical protein
VRVSFFKLKPKRVFSNSLTRNVFFSKFPWKDPTEIRCSKFTFYKNFNINFVKQNAFDLMIKF